jgi:hypothetical protein
MDESAYRPFGLRDQCKSLNWWRWVRKALGLDGTTELPKLWLSLSNLFSIFFPEETDLYENAHHADADTEMTRLLLRLFARAWLNEPLDDEPKNTIWNPAWSRKHNFDLKLDEDEDEEGIDHAKIGFTPADNPGKDNDHEYGNRPSGPSSPPGKF